MQRYNRFEVEWVLGPNHYCYSTKTIREIEEIGDCHYRVRTYPDFPGDNEILEFVIHKEDGIWMIRSEAFEPEPEYEFEYTQADHSEIWVADLGEERMEIRGIFPESRKFLSGCKLSLDPMRI